MSDGARSAEEIVRRFMSENTALVQRFEDNLVAGEMGKVLDTLHDDVVIHENDHVPYPGDHHGKDGFVRLAEAFYETWDFRSEFEIEVLPAGEDRVLVLANAKVSARNTGKKLDLQIAEIHKVEDGKITEISVFYWDSAAMAEATDSALVLPRSDPA